MSAENDAYSALRTLKREITGKGLSDDEVSLVRALIDKWRADAMPASAWSADHPITLNVALEIVGHEAIVQEAYLDSGNVWTWSVGITNASGHTVYPRYKDNPQPIEKCLEVYLWLLRERYAPAVLKAFAGHQLTEYQFAAALSFHYNTGAIGRADWVKLFLDGADASRERFMDWRRPPSIIPRREKERNLFFDGEWSNDGHATVFPVRKPGYHPDFSHPQRIDVRPILQGML